MPDWDYKGLTFFLSVLNSIGFLVAIIYTHMMSKQKANADSIDELKIRVTQIEKSIEHMPTHNDIVNLNKRIDQVGQGLTRLEGTMEQVDNNVKLIQEHLLRQNN